MAAVGAREGDCEVSWLSISLPMAMLGGYSVEYFFSFLWVFFGRLHGFRVAALLSFQKNKYAKQ